MRTAPVGLVFSPAEAFERGVDFAAITHGHPSGYLSAGYIAELIAHIVDGHSLETAITQTTARLMTYGGHGETLAQVEQAQQSHTEGRSVEAAVCGLGEGWVGEEALGIALFCALRFTNNYRAGVIAAANHNGDSDSTASMTGAILGTYLGIQAIPQDWVEQVENCQRLDSLAEELYITFKC